MWRWTVEQDRRSVGVEGEGMERTRSKQHRGVSWNLWNDRLFVVGLPQTMSRPLRAVSRRLLGVSGVVALLPECRRGLPSVHRGIIGHDQIFSTKNMLINVNFDKS